ncbi:unnamed protein product [Clonostachys solani]|uniref:Uncharacterized protein n=1 Tax=Clonostachys solani TaxID=160281 RepID=A0A9N9Z2L9_9HYPO|nr:unnamed protein product [Clonostachys solani]
MSDYMYGNKRVLSADDALLSRHKKRRTQEHQLRRQRLKRKLASELDVFEQYIQALETQEDETVVTEEQLADEEEDLADVPDACLAMPSAFLDGMIAQMEQACGSTMNSVPESALDDIKRHDD